MTKDQFVSGLAATLLIGILAALIGILATSTAHPPPIDPHVGVACAAGEIVYVHATDGQLVRAHCGPPPSGSVATTQPSVYRRFVAYCASSVAERLVVHIDTSVAP